MSSSTGQEKRTSIGYFDLPKPGKYTLSIIGNKQERIFSLGKSLFSHGIYVIGGFFLGFALSFIGAAAAVILFVLGIIVLVRETKTANTPPLQQ